MKTVKCPGCSANLSYNLDSELLRCEYCATVSIINDNKIVETYPITNGNLMDAHSSFCLVAILVVCRNLLDFYLKLCLTLCFKIMF